MREKEKKEGSGLRRKSGKGFGEDRIACHPICAGHGMPYLILDHGLYDCLCEPTAYPRPQSKARENSTIADEKMQPGFDGVSLNFGYLLFVVFL